MAEHQSKPFFTLPCDFYDVALDEDMPLEELGQLFRAVYHYDHYGTIPEIDNKYLKVCFKTLKRGMDAGDQKYKEKCEYQRARRNSGKRKLEVIEGINEFFEGISSYDYCKATGKDPEKVERFLDTMSELRVAELEQFLDELNEFMIKDIMKSVK